MNRSTQLAACAVAFAAISPTLDADSFGSGGNAFTMDFVTIGNPGNTGDTTGFGAVAYEFRMGTYEVSVDMVTKANSAGSLGLTFDNRGADQPATSITWFEAARFVNWLNGSAGLAPAYKFTLAPGDAGYSATDANVLWVSGDAGYDAANPFRNSNAKYFLPSDNEWYKAAYGSPAGTYYNYPIGPDGFLGQPKETLGGTTPGTIVFRDNFGVDPSSPADITFAGGLSPYGTMAQGGNAWEWLESATDGGNDSPSENRTMRGGSWQYGLAQLQSTFRPSADPASSNFDSGFRVAAVPESSTVWFEVAGILALVYRRTRK